MTKRFPLPSVSMITVVIAMALPDQIFCQMIGGTSSGSESPSEIKAHTLSPSALSNDVDLFSGTFSASYPLGGVATPGGLSYDLLLNYSGAMTGGATPTLQDGIPYGQGWSLNLPTITMSTAYRHRMRPIDERDIANDQTLWQPNPPTYNMDMNGQYVDALTDGEGFWYEPILNIPGVVSGRLVFKKFSNDGAVFVLNSFETYVEATLMGSTWEVVTADGRLYEFGAQVKAVQMPENKRWLDYEEVNNLVLEPLEGVGPARLKMRNAFMAKEHTLTWYCNRIWNSIHSPQQSITFEYKGYGKFDMLKEYHQSTSFNFFFDLIFFNGSTDVTPFDEVSGAPNTETFQEILLQRVTASTLLAAHEKLDLVYANNLHGPSMVNPANGVAVPEGDDLYQGVVVEQWGEGSPTANGTQFANWSRYPHYANSSFPKPGGNNWSVPARDPYTNELGQHHKTPPTFQGPNTLLFEDGFLESPGVLTNAIVPGDLWEIRTKIATSGTQGANFDINVCTGKPMQLGNPIPSHIWKSARGVTLFSTFDRMIKWNTYGDPVVQTSNMFVMPYVHNDPTIGNNGIHIQIGPGNSENNFNMGSGIDLMDLTPVGMNGSPSAYMSYPHSLWKLRRALNSTLRPTGQFEDGLLSHDPVPSNFGIGLPWAGLLPIHHRFEAVLGYEPEGTLRNPALDAGMAFWWSNGTVNMPWINKPTVLTPNTGIKKVELIRYGKQPWMLKHVIKSVRNGNLTNDEGWESETDLELVHTRVDQQVPVLIRGANPNSPHFEPYYRSIYELDRIIHRPIANNIIADPIQLDQQPTTRFVYSDAKGMAPLLEDFYCANLEMDYPRAIPKRQIISLSRLLTTVHDQLGTITKVIYNDPLSSNLAHFDILDGQNPGVVFGIPECNPNASLIPATGTIIPTVKEIHRSDERGEGIRVTTYTYGDRSSKYRGYPFLNQRYRFGRSAGTSFGYTTVTVSEATGANGGRVSREYDFHADVEQVTYTSSPVSFDDEPYSAEFQSPIWPPSETDVNDILLWGRIKEIRVKNPQGTILERTSIDHEATLAFENGSLRPSQGKRLHSLNKFDYMDYMPGFDLSAGTTSGRTELENMVGGLQGPRFLEADVIPEGSAFHIPMPESYLNSYFIKKVRETHTVYDPAACSMGTTVPGTTDPIEGVVMFNPDGTNTANNHTNSNAEALITALEQEGLTEATKALLLSSSPLQESVIQKALSVVDETTAKRLKEILDAQAKLTDERLTQAVDNADKLEPDDAAKILAAQPVLSDPVLSEILGSSKISGAEKVKVLLSRDHLATSLLFELLGTTPPLSPTQTMEVLHAQPPLTKAFLFDLIADETLPASVRASVLIEQPAVSDDLFQEVLKMKSGWTPEAVEDLLVNGTAYPADPLIIGLLKQDPPLPSEVLRNILAANPNDWSEALRIEVAGSYALRFPDRDHLLRNGATGLLQFCGSPCASSNMGISTITDYSYYEAGPDGRTNAPGYRALLGLEDEQAVPMIQLKWEPSWLLFSTRTSSPQYPDAFQEQRAFYYQDLRNRYDRHWTMLADEENFQVDDDENGNYPIEDNFGISIPQVFGPHSDPDEATGHYIVPKMEVMEVLREFDDRTDRPFETHVISKAAAKDHPVIRATYHQYSARWKWDDLPTYELVVSGVPCFPDTPPGIQVDLNSDMPLASTITPYTKLNSSNWQDHVNEVPDGYRLVQDKQGRIGMMKNNDWNSAWDNDPDLTVLHASNSVLPTTGQPKMAPFRLLMKNALLPKAEHVQADERLLSIYEDERYFTEEIPLMHFKKLPDEYPEDGPPLYGEWVPLFPYEVITNEERLAYNWDAQPTLIQNERGLKTKVEYSIPVHTHSYTAEPCTMTPTEFYNAPAHPLSITVGYGLPNAQTTTYTYTNGLLVGSVTDPNGMVMNYSYDRYGRLTTTSRNSELLGTNQYHQFDNSTASTYDAIGRTQQNWVATTARIGRDDLSGLRTRAFVDPNGRAFASMAAPTPDITNLSFSPDQVVLSGLQDLDPWDRTLRSYKPRLVANGSGSNNYALTAAMANTAGLPKSETSYENDHRSRPLFAAAPGEDITTGHSRKTRYRFLNHIAFACDLGLSAQEVGLLMPGNSADYRWKRTESEDEDGNISRSYTNALGQQVATASVIQGTTKSITLFNYDDQGNLALVIDPKKQHTTYKYNLLGWMYSKTTVDGGTTKYLYDVSGNVVLEQDATGAAGEPDAYFEVASEPWNRPWYRRYRFDGFGRPVAQERVRADHPAAHGYRGTMVQSWPLDIMSYETREMEVEWPTQLEEWDPWDVSSYTFTSGSTIDRFARIEVMRRVQDEYGSSSYNFVPAMVGMDDILVDPILEKTWTYDWEVLSDAALSATLFPGTETDLAFREHLLGRPSHVVTYPHRTYAEFPLTEDQNGVLVWNGASQPAVHYEFYSYNTEGQPAWQLQQFNANGITTDARGLTVRLDYANYDLMGNLRTVNVDVNHDMQLDMQQHYVYDAWGRLKDVYLNLGDDTDSGERIASYTYDDALGLMTSTKYHRSPCDVPGQNEVIEVTTNTYDVRDRLTGITGNRYAETLYYDGALPVHPVAGTLQGDQHYNGAINGLQHAYMLQGLTGYQDGIMDLPTKQAFRYDGLGRMTHTDAVVGDLVAGVTDPTNSRFELGDERYNFDRSGNLTWMRRIGLFDQGNTANQMVDWIYQYNAGKNQLRKVLASSSSAMPSRDYTYDPLGNLLTDSYRRIGDSRYGRANMPFRVEQDQDGTLYASDYLYGPTDQRIYKRYGKVGGDVEVQEFNLMDAAGRVLGVLDMNGGINNGDGPMGAWTWYAFGNQRFAKVTPPTTQQPSYFTSDLAKKQQADPDNVKYQTVVDFLVLQNLQPEGIQYPLRTVLIQTTTNGYTMYTEAAYDIAKYTDPVLADRPQILFTFESEKKSLPLKRHTSEEEVYVTVEELLGEGQMKSGANGIPFAYTEYEDTQLHDVTFYLHDHLGNMRVTYTTGCTPAHPPTPGQRTIALEHAADYYPYGSILREMVHTTEEKYLSTHHQRDQETGLDYRGARYYDSDVARFLSLDPLAADYASWTPYNFVGGNPISMIDPDGKGWWDVVVGGTVAMAHDFGASLMTTATLMTAVHQTLSDQNDFQRGAVVGHEFAFAVGTALEIDGARNVAAGLTTYGGAGGTILMTAGAGTPIAVPVAAAGLIEAGAGAIEGAYGGFVANNARGFLEARREGDFTPTQKRVAKEKNASENGGQMQCEDCGNSLRNVKNEKGVSTPKDQAQVHHNPPLHEGGGRNSTPEVLCPGCHQQRHLPPK